MNELVFEQVLFIVFLIAIFGFVLFKRFTRSRWRKRSINRNDLHVSTVSSRKTFHKLLFARNEHGISKMTDIVTCQLESGQKGKRVVGAFMFIDKNLLVRNKDLIKRKIVVRDSSMRKRAHIPGRKATWYDKVEVHGQTYNLWHATHLIPFRYCLSDGDFPNLLFMGTAHLNMGAKYDMGYAPASRGTADSNAARVAHLKELVNASKNGLKLDYPEVPGLRRYGFVQYSLDDFERLADYLINSRKNDHFKYGVECFYSNGSVIPDEVQVVMINLTKNKLEFSVKLKNTK